MKKFIHIAYMHIRFRLWLIRWNRWLNAIYEMPAREARIQITKLRWSLMKAGYPENIEVAFLRALEITERGIAIQEEQVRTRTCKKRASAHFDLTDV